MEAARTAAARGFDVTLFEKGESLGGNIALSSKQYLKGALKGLVDWYVAELALLKVKVLCGKEAGAGDIRQLAPTAAVIAVGGRAIVPDIPGVAQDNCMTVPDILTDMKSSGNSVIIAGGGLTGCETAIDLAQQGKSVTLVEMAEHVLDNSTHVPIMVSQMINDLLVEHKVNVLTNSALKEILSDGAVIASDGRETKLTSDSIILALGMESAHNSIADELVGSGIAVYPVGDYAVTGNVYNAIHSGYEIARNL